MTKTISFTLAFLLFFSSSVQAQEAEPSLSLSVLLLEGTPAPFSGLLVTESHATQCIEDAAAVDRLTVELAVRSRELEVSSMLRDTFIGEQRARIEALNTRSWWDDNGNVFMLGLGLVLGVVASALVAGLVTN